ncbi:MAG: heparinase II/III family protein [Calditrichia bacterium]
MPRDRLVTDSELFSLFDFSEDAMQQVKAVLAKRDTTAALKALNAYLLAESRPNYFFASRDIRKRAKAFKNAYPDETRAILARADEFVATYGKDVDWLQPGKDLQGRPHTPNTVRYLARQARATDFALSYFLKKDDVYLDVLQGQMKDFVQDYQAGKTERGRNSVFERFYAGHRLRNWLFADQLLMHNSKEIKNKRVYMLRVFLMHGARLIDDCIKFHWGNHQLHGLAGLYEMSTMYPELPVMRYWNKEALRVIMEHISTEIKPDGFQFERASHYFKLDILNYFRIYQISKVNGIKLPDLFVQRFRSMFDAIVALARPDFKLPVMQDAQAPASVLNGLQKLKPRNSGQDGAELTDKGVQQFISLGAVVFKSSEYRFFSEPELPAEYAWYFDEAVIADYANQKVAKPPTSSSALDSSAYYVMRSGRDKGDLYMLIDAGLAKYKPDHTHGGILGVTGFSFGEEILPSYAVRYNDPSYRTMKNSLVKSIALVDDVLQGGNWISNHARTGFGIWDKLPKPEVLDWQSGSNFDFFAGSHNAYDSLNVRYQRKILFFKPFCWLFLDEFQADATHRYQQIWQGNFQLDELYNRAWLTTKNQRLHILQADPSDMELTKRQNFWTHSMQFEKAGVEDYRFQTVVYPQAATDSIVPDIRLFERKPYRQVVIFAGAYRHTLYVKKQPSFTLGEIETDAEMVAISYKDDEPYAVFFHNGTDLDLRFLELNSPAKTSVELKKIASGSWEVLPLNTETDNKLIKKIRLNIR